MSHTPHESAPGPHGAADDVDYGKVVGVGVVSLIIFAIAIFWAFKLMNWRIASTEAKTGTQKAFEMGQAEVGIVDQVPFTSDKRLPKWRAERKQALESYGWVDKSKGIVRIPIEAAMDKVAGGVMPEGAPQ